LTTTDPASFGLPRGKNRTYRGCPLNFKSTSSCETLPADKYCRSFCRLTTDTFSARSGAGRILVTNGDADGDSRINSARILLNGHPVFGPSDFNQCVAHLSPDIDLSAQNTLKIELKSHSGKDRDADHEERSHKGQDVDHENRSYKNHEADHDHKADHEKESHGHDLRFFGWLSHFFHWPFHHHRPHEKERPYLTITITEDVPLPTASLSIAPQTIISGQSATLNWTCTQADTCSIDPGIGQVQSSGTLQVSPSATTTYTLTAKNIAGSATANATVTVYIPPTATISADPQIIVAGQSATLSWNSTNADSVTIDPGIGPVPAGGSMAVSPAQTTTYTMTATGPGGTATANTTVTVTYPVPTVTIKAAPDTITSGQSLTLTWSSTNATGCDIEPGIGAVGPSGSQMVSPTQDTVYVITATGPGGSATASAGVTVKVANSAPTVHLEPADITINPGDTTTLTWTSTGADKAYIDNGVGTVPASSRPSTPPFSP
jgi:hypothetical protein